MAQPGPLGSKYTLVRGLGSGTLGEVWLGHDQDDRPLAFKLLRPEYADDPLLAQRFVQERSALLNVDSENVVRMHDLVIEGSTLAIVMDLVEGGDLRAALRAAGTMAPAEVARIGSGIAAGLEAVHSAGLIHRDVKPENVLLDSTAAPPVPRVCDFGIARLAEASAATRTSMAMGTPHYAAPEVAEGRHPTPAVDVYSLGILLYELACGVTPFEGGSHLAVLRRHADALAVRPEGIPDPLWATIEAMLAKVPDQRPTAGQVHRDLAALAPALADLPAAPRLLEPPPVTVTSPAPVAPAPAPAPVPTDPSPQQPPPAAARRRFPVPAAIALVAVALIAIAAVVITTTLGSGDDDPPPDAGSPADVPDQLPDQGVPPGLPTEVLPENLPENITVPDFTPPPMPTSIPFPTMEPKPAPDLVGLDQSRARIMLVGVRFSEEYEVTTDVPANRVIAQSVPPGELITDRIVVTFSAAPLYLHSLDDLSQGAGFTDEAAATDGQEYSVALVSTGPEGHGEWNLGRGYDRLIGTIGRSDGTTDTDAEVEVAVLLDQQEVWRERVGLWSAAELDLDVGDALRLTIEYEAVGDADDAELVLGDLYLLEPADHDG